MKSLGKITLEEIRHFNSVEWDGETKDIDVLIDYIWIYGPEDLKYEITKADGKTQLVIW